MGWVLLIFMFSGHEMKEPSIVGSGFPTKGACMAEGFQMWKAGTIKDYTCVREEKIKLDNRPK